MNNRDIKMMLATVVAVCVASTAVAQIPVVGGPQNIAHQLKEAIETSPAAPANESATKAAMQHAIARNIIPTKVESTSEGRRVYLIVSEKKCVADVMERDGKSLVSAFNCEK